MDTVICGEAVVSIAQTWSAVNYILPVQGIPDLLHGIGGTLFGTLHALGVAIFLRDHHFHPIPKNEPLMGS